MSLARRLPAFEESELEGERPPHSTKASPWNARRLLLAALLLLVLVAVFVSWLQTITPAGIVIHHTGPLEQDPITMAFLDQFHRDRGFGAFYYGRVYHIAYHYVIFPDGRLVPGRPERLRGAHTRHYNNYLGIVLVGNFSSKTNAKGEDGLQQPTEAQLSALVLLCRRLTAKYAIPLRQVFPHGELGQTLCPGSGFPWNELTSRLNVAPQPHCPPLR